MSHDSFIFLLQENNDLEFYEIKRLSNYIYISFPGEYISQCIISTNTSNENLLKSIKSLRVYNIFYISLGLRNDKSNLLFNKSELSLNNVYQYINTLHILPIQYKVKNIIKPILKDSDCELKIKEYFDINNELLKENRLFCKDIIKTEDGRYIYTSMNLGEMIELNYEKRYIKFLNYGYIHMNPTLRRKKKEYCRYIERCNREEYIFYLENYYNNFDEFKIHLNCDFLHINKNKSITKSCRRCFALSYND